MRLFERAPAGPRPARGPRLRFVAGAPVCAVAVLAWAPPAQALELGWLLGGGVRYSDNIVRADEGGERSDRVHDVRAGITLREETPRLEASLDGLLAYEHYARETFDDGFVFRGSGALDWALVPDRLTWVVRDSFQQVPQNTRSVVTRGTEQDANAFVTGPDLELPLSAVDTLRVSARWGDFYFAETEEDNTRQVFAAGVARALSPISEISLNARVEDVSFDEELPEAERENFVEDSGFVRYERALARGGRISLDLGGYELRRDELPDADGELVRLAANRPLSANVEAGLRIGRGSTDVGAALSGFRGDPLAADTDVLAVTGDVGERRYARGYYNHELGRFSLSLAGGAAEEDFEVADELDRDRAYATLGLDYRMTVQRNVYLEATRTDIDYVVDEADDTFGDHHNNRYTLGINQRIGRSLTTLVELTRYRRHADDGGAEYEEDVVALSLVYGLGVADVLDRVDWNGEGV